MNPPTEVLIAAMLAPPAVVLCVKFAPARKLLAVGAGLGILWLIYKAGESAVLADSHYAVPLAAAIATCYLLVRARRMSIPKDVDDRASWPGLKLRRRESDEEKCRERCRSNVEDFQCGLRE